MKSIIESIREFIMEFPELKDGALLVDYLGNSPIEYTVEPVPCSPVVRKFIDGSCEKQFLFLFASREAYSDDVNQCIENLSFYENFSDWIYEQNNSGNLPVLDGNRTAEELEILTGGYQIYADTNTARYQIQLRLIYREN
ncbi:MAG: chloramphenicol resistance protein [Ruminococcus sp.]|nr:chloramphenicol resistance protein [Ruminococcus sp.]